MSLIGTRRKPLARTRRLRRVSRDFRSAADLRLEWGTAVRERDRGCQLPDCRCQGPLEAHHVFPKGTYPDLRYDVDNGITLCKRAHEMWHRHSKLAKQEWTERFPDRAARLAAKL